MILALEQQVCSLESAKRLKELGCTQDSLFQWVINPVEIRLRYSGGRSSETLTMLTGNEYISAYTVAELGEFLPQYLNFNKGGQTTFLEIIHNDDTWTVGYNDLNGSRHYEKNKKECEARSKMLIYLLENKLIEVPK